MLIFIKEHDDIKTKLDLIFSLTEIDMTENFIQNLIKFSQSIEIKNISLDQIINKTERKQSKIDEAYFFY